MRTSSRPSILFSVLIAPLLAFGGAARAELGGSVSPLPGTQTHMAATLRSQAVVDTTAATTAANYSMHELTTEIGTTVREYTDAGGTVFAVTWEGPVKPDLQMLLGPYFQTLLDAANQPGFLPSGTGPVQVNNADLVVFSGGHPRAFFGRAYLPAFIPGGVNIDVLP